MENIFVTKPFLPPLREFDELFKEIWATRNLTNNGKFHKQLEDALCSYLGVKYISLFSNGTLALITALQALDICGEVITTPYSFVATSHALKWNNISPVFSDIDPVSCNLDPFKIREKIHSKTSAILPVHVYGNPCLVDEFNKISAETGVKIIYDACHTFNVRIGNEPVLNFGDLSVMSFHATKVFNTFEGGAIVCHDAEMKQHIDDLKNFGFRNETTVVAAGINAKMNEFQAAVGLLQLKYIDEVIEKRKALTERYNSLLSNVLGIRTFAIQENVKHCYSYYPIFIDDQIGPSRDDIYEILKKQNVFSRRYFFPLISHFPVYNMLASSKAENLPVAESITKQVLCLPLFPDLKIEEQDTIINIIKNI